MMDLASAIVVRRRTATGLAPSSNAPTLSSTTRTPGPLDSSSPTQSCPRASVPKPF